MRLENHFTIAERLPLDRLKRRRLPFESKESNTGAQPPQIRAESVEWQRLIVEKKKKQERL